MADRHTLEELNNCSREELITIVLMMQGQLDTLNENIERLIEQVRIANSIEDCLHNFQTMNYYNLYIGIVAYLCWYIHFSCS